MPLIAKDRSAQPAYLPHLDGVRAVAVMLVLAAHLPPILGGRASELAWRLTQAGRVGAFGVEIFFVLSGFLITRLLLHERLHADRIRLKTFYIRRAYRVFPIYYLCVAAVVMAVPTSRLGLFGLLTYTFNYYHIAYPDPYPLEHAWSLAVEEQFYLIWPWIIAHLPMRHGRRLTQVVLPSLAVLAAIAFAAFLPAETAGALTYKSLATRMLSLSLGAAIAFREIEVRTAPATHRPGAAFVGLALLAAAAGGRSLGLVAPGGWYWCIVLPGAALIGFDLIAHLVLAGPASRLKAVLATPPLRYVGRISYGIYLYHLIVLYALGINEASLHGAGASAQKVVLALVLTFVVAALSFHYIERPLLRRRDRAPSLAPPQPSFQPYSPAATPLPAISPRGTGRLPS